MHFGILCRFFSSLSRLKPYFYSVLSVYQNDLNLLIRMQYFVVIITYLPTEAIKMAFEELWLSNSSFEKTNTQQKKRWLKWIQLTAVIIDNFINSWQNWFPQKILITADIDRRASCFLSICVFFLLLLVEIRLINECGWRHTHKKKRTKKKAKTPNICIYKRGSNQSQCPNWPILKHIPLNSRSAKEMNDGQNNGILTNFNRLLNGFTSLIGISGFY